MNAQPDTLKTYFWLLLDILLVGGASLKAGEFERIIESATNIQ